VLRPGAELSPAVGSAEGRRATGPTLVERSPIWLAIQSIAAPTEFWLCNAGPSPAASDAAGAASSKEAGALGLQEDAAAPSVARGALSLAASCWRSVLSTGAAPASNVTAGAELLDPAEPTRLFRSDLMRPRSRSYSW